MSRRLIAAALALGLTGCSRSGESPKAGGPPPGIAVVRGTTLEAATRTPLAGVQVQGPQGSSAVSDQHGRFTLRGLRVGATGELTAKSKDGLEARNPLQPLQNEVLEVVMHLRRP